MSAVTELRAISSPDEIQAALAEEQSALAPDLLICGDGGLRAGLWWRGTPAFENHPAGTIGLFQAPDAGAAKLLLDRSCQELRKRGCRAAVGPMERDTWHRHRLVTDFGSEPQFFLEPWTPKVWPVWWAAAGFAPVAEYFSALNTRPAWSDPRVARARERLSDAGVTLREFDPMQAERELAAIFKISDVAFRGNFLFTPITEADFSKLYRPVIPMLDPGLILFAECEGSACGFVFAFRNPPGSGPATVILKTLAVLPGRKYAGLGNLLVDEIHRRALKLSCDRVIHALMHSSNNSSNLSRRHATPMRRYAVMARRL